MKQVRVGEFFRIRWTGQIVEVIESGEHRSIVLRADGSHDPFDIGNCYLIPLGAQAHRWLFRSFAQAYRAVWVQPK